MRYECYFCHIKTIENYIRKFDPEAMVAEDLIFSVNELLSENRGMLNPKLAMDIHRIARVRLANTNLFGEEKFKANDLLLNKYNYWQNIVNQSDAPLFTAAKLAVIGNIIDYGAHSIHGTISGQIEKLFQKKLKTDDRIALAEEIGKANSVLYIGDNCGEIVFDKLFIETMKHPNVIYAVRGKPVINDVTFDDALQVGMDRMCRVISSGSDAPSTLTEFCSDEFLEIFRTADLIISKGQGNFEGLMDCVHPNIFFLLIAKCAPMAELLGVQKNDMVITKKQARKYVI
jgi:hypothetical protein